MTGVVLMGGLSARLGQDKTRLSLQGLDGQNLLERTVHVLAQCCDEVVLSCRKGQGTTTSQTVGTLVQGVRRIYDVTPRLGPIGGLYTCLQSVQGPILALSCDLPFMTRAVLEQLVVAHNKRPKHMLMTMYKHVETGSIEPLTAIYESACLPYFETSLQKGRRALHQVMPKELCLCIPYTDAKPFFNINNPSDLALAQKMLATP